MIPQGRVQSKIEQLFADETPETAAESQESDSTTIDRGQMSLCCIPLMNAEQAILGLMELACMWRIVTEDVRLLEGFAVFATMSLERKALCDLAEPMDR
jgi:hypothetical protein